MKIGQPKTNSVPNGNGSSPEAANAARVAISHPTNDPESSDTNDNPTTIKKADRIGWIYRHILISPTPYDYIVTRLGVLSIDRAKLLQIIDEIWEKSCDEPKEIWLREAYHKALGILYGIKSEADLIKAVQSAKKVFRADLRRFPSLRSPWQFHRWLGGDLDEDTANLELFRRIFGGRPTDVLFKEYSDGRLDCMKKGSGYEAQAFGFHTRFNHLQEWSRYQARKSKERKAATDEQAVAKMRELEEENARQKKTIDEMKLAIEHCQADSKDMEKLNVLQKTTMNEMKLTLEQWQAHSKDMEKLAARNKIEAMVYEFGRQYMVAFQKHLNNMAEVNEEPRKEFSFDDDDLPF